MIPRRIFGRCSRCNGGGDYPTSSLTSADSQSNIDETINRTELKMYMGKALCPLCISELKAERESRMMAKKHSSSDRFRTKAGFKYSV